MVRGICLLGASAAITYAWLSATVAPLGRSVRGALLHHGSFAAVALAAGAALLWTIALCGGAFLLLSCVHGVAAAVLARPLVVRDGLLFGIAMWAAAGLLTRRVPRFGDDVEIASALAVVALIKDDPGTLARVEVLYRAHALGLTQATVQAVRVVRVTG